MNLHIDKEAFYDLAVLTAKNVGIPTTAVIRDYYIVMMLQMLEHSEYADQCIFKGGTSLSKCYPGSIARFSEDIDLTFLPKENMSKKQYGRSLKIIEEIMTEGACIEKIAEERNDRNKSAYVWFEEDQSQRIKLEIGSSVRPDPYMPMSLKTYIQDFLEEEGRLEVIQRYELKEVKVNTLCIQRTFLDKVMSVKRHAICGTLEQKVRHIYDVTMLYGRDDIQAFLNNKQSLKELIIKTKETDRFYLEKRSVSKDYDPVGAYNFISWQQCFNEAIRMRYESLHKDLLYTDQKQDFKRAIAVFREISNLFAELGE